MNTSKPSLLRYYICLALTSMLSFSATAQVVFTKATYPSGMYPTSIAWSDFNGDGKPDLVTGSDFWNEVPENGVAVSLNNGDGTYAPAVNYLTEDQYTSVTAVQTGDLNGDGHPDIIAARWNRTAMSDQHHLVILWNDGNGTFPTKTEYAISGGWAMGLAVSDLNGDGLPDVALSATAEDIAVYINNGNGTLAFPVAYPVNYGRGLSIADVNGDGRPDMLSADGPSNTVSVLLGNGDGTFATAVTYPTGNYAIHTSISDLNGDGHNDLVVANRNDNTISVLLNNGNGTFAAHTTYAVGNSPAGTAIGDLDGDGHADIAAVSQGSAYVSILINKGDGTFYQQRMLSHADFLPFDVVIADLDSDGRNDIATVSAGHGTTHVFLNRGGYAPGSGNILYVNKNVDQNAAGYTGNGSSWDNALPELADALQWADDNQSNWTTGNPLQIWVAKGEYQPTSGTAFSLVEHVRVYGGFADTGNPAMGDRNWAGNPTILKGNGASVVRNVGTLTASAVLDGFTLTDGNASGVGNLSRGGGIFLDEAAPTLTNLIIRDNTADLNGGGIHFVYSASVLTNVSIYNNSAGQNGGGVYHYGNNSLYPPATLTNVTISYNTAANGGSDWYNHSGVAIVRNSIIWDMSANSVFGELYDVKNSLVQGQTHSAYTAVVNNNLPAATDPLFNDTESGDFTLQTGSPAIDAGDNGYITASTDLAGNPRIQNNTVDLGAYENQVTPPCVVHIPDANFKAALLANTAINTDGDGEIQCNEAIAFTGTISVANRGIADLTGIEAFVNIVALYCDRNQLTSLDVSQNTALTTLWCDNNQLTTLDVSQNLVLVYLFCYDNQLTTLDVNQNTTLEYLNCSNNQLTALDVNQNTVLKGLTCDNNQLVTLDVSQNTALVNLYGYDNQLTALDVSNNTALEQLNCSNNQLTALDVSQNTALVMLLCNNNQLTTLNVKNGNNSSVANAFFRVNNNPNLTCIQVDNIAYSTANWTTYVDSQSSFSEDCSNQPPTDISLSSTSVNQSGGANAVVGTLSSTDPDNGNTHTYTLVSGTGSDHNSLFNISGNQLRVDNPANMAAGSYSVRIRTEDNHGATFDKPFTVTVVDDIAPVVTTVSVPANNTYIAGQNLDFTVHFSEPVTVNTSGGTPRIALTIGTATRYAGYFSGSGASAITFRYTVAEGDLDTDGITVGTLGLTGGAIQDEANNNAVLTLNSVGNTGAVLVDAVPPAAPTGLTATFGNAQVNLQWDANAETDLDGYRVYFGTTAGQLSLLASVPAGTTAYLHQSLTNGTTYYYEVRAVDRVGNASPGSAMVSATPQAPQTITFNPLPDKVYGDAAFALTATASSDLTVSYSSSDPAIASVSGSIVTIHAAGTVTITASQSGNAAYLPAADVEQVLTINKAPQTITFISPGTLARDAGTVALDVSGSSGLPVTLSIDDEQVATLDGLSLIVKRLGTVTVTATQPGNHNYLPADPVSVSIRIANDANAALPIRVHQAVSPNGDGINDFLMLEGIRDYPENRITIFDKSGKVLAEIESYDNRDRVFTGQYVRDGTYYYYLDVKDGNEWKREKGFFVVKRTVN